MVWKLVYVNVDGFVNCEMDSCVENVKLDYCSVMLSMR